MKNINHSLKTGIFFGLTSGITTTLGMMVGLNAGTQSRMVVLGGVLMIAIADALSDAMGIHVSEESEGKHTEIEIWTSTIATFLAKFFFSLTFVVPILILELSTAVVVSIVWGLFSLAVISAYLEKIQGNRPWKSIAEHLLLAIIVITLTYYIGDWIHANFNQ